MRHLILGFLAVAAAAQQPDPLAPLRAFEGKWEGAASGEPGKGVSRREYSFDLAGRFLVARNLLPAERSEASVARHRRRARGPRRRRI
jgi:hypothetical protein